MKINLITPHGYCFGVKKAIDIAKNVANDSNVEKPIYLLGNIIHNAHVIEEIKELGIKVIESKKTRYDMLDEIESGTVIFSAHGVSPRVYEKALNKKLNIVDATCPNVKLVHNRIIKNMNEGNNILYIGTKNHPECEGVLEIDSNIKLIESIDDLKDLDKNKKYYITCQTTLSLLDLKELFSYIDDNFTNKILDNKICLATLERQESLLKSDSDMAIVVGDKSSSNSKKLQMVFEKKYHKPSILIESVKDLIGYDFSNINSISLTSGASTPEYILTEVYDYLIKL